MLALVAVLAGGAAASALSPWLVPAVIVGCAWRAMSGRCRSGFLRWQPDGAWALRLGPESERRVELVRDPFVTPWLVALEFRDRGNTFRCVIWRLEDPVAVRRFVQRSRAGQAQSGPPPLETGLV